MTEYDFKDFRTERREGLKWLFWGLGICVILGILLWVLSSAGLIGRTVVEREVFERSFQYSEATKRQIATYEAQIEEINVQLASPDLDTRTRQNLNAQRSAIRIQLKAAQERGE
jgi:hypothetical protein